MVMGLKNLRRVGTHIYFLIIFFSGKNIILCILKGISPFKMHKIIFFPENLKKILGFTCKFRQVQVTLNTGIFLFGLINNLIENMKRKVFEILEHLPQVISKSYMYEALTISQSSLHNSDKAASKSAREKLEFLVRLRKSIS